jgi:hypothetical protein
MRKHEDDAPACRQAERYITIYSHIAIDRKTICQALKNDLSRLDKALIKKNYSDCLKTAQAEKSAIKTVAKRPFPQPVHKLIHSFCG